MKMRYLLLSLVVIWAHAAQASWYCPEWLFGPPVLPEKIDTKALVQRVATLELHFAQQTLMEQFEKRKQQIVDFGQSITRQQVLQVGGTVAACYGLYSLYAIKSTESWLRKSERWSEWYFHCTHKNETPQLLLMEIQKVYKAPYSLHAVFAIQLFLKDLAWEIAACEKYHKISTKLCSCKCKWVLDEEMVASMQDRLENLLYIKDTCVHQMLTYL